MIISQSEKTVPLSKIIDDSMMPAEDTDTEWLQYIRDHTDLIKNNSTLFFLDAEVMKRYRYRLEDFLFEKRNGIHYRQYASIVRIINRLGCNLDFNESVTEIYLPTPEYITELRSMYRLIWHRKNKL